MDGVSVALLAILVLAIRMDGVSIALLAILVLAIRMDGVSIALLAILVLAIRMDGVSVALLAILVLGPSGALRCSQCESGYLGNCMLSAPEATPCLSGETETSAVNCMIAKQSHSNGSLISFTRGCTMVRVGTGCVAHHDNTTLCYETCHKDNCNQATHVTVSTATLSLLFTVIRYFNLC